MATVRTSISAEDLTAITEASGAMHADGLTAELRRNLGQGVELWTGSSSELLEIYRTRRDRAHDENFPWALDIDRLVAVLESADEVEVFTVHDSGGGSWMGLLTSRDRLRVLVRLGDPTAE